MKRLKKVERREEREVFFSSFSSFTLLTILSSRSSLRFRRPLFSLAALLSPSSLKSTPFFLREAQLRPREKRNREAAKLSLSLFLFSLIDRSLDLIRMATTAPNAEAAAAPAAARPASIPVTMLSGFLGAGAFTRRTRQRERGTESSEGKGGTRASRTHALTFVVETKREKKSTSSGKTTVLRHLLQNSSHLKIGCVVNDVADVNIDAKLVRNDRSRQRNNNGGDKDGDASKDVNGEGGGGKGNNNTTSDLADTIELANGCACCSIQDELFGSFEQLLSLADAKGASYDR